ncbi:MAG: DUF5693 family protein [Synergistota bacterium]|nr:DUF5693 family protein [Synergistota bacterium]
MRFSWRRFFALICVLVFVLSLPGLLSRWNVEKNRRSSVILVDWSQIPPLSVESGNSIEKTLQMLVDSGSRGIMIGEFTGDELENGELPLWYGPLEDLPVKALSSLPEGLTGTALMFDSKGAYAETWRDFLSLCFPHGSHSTVDGKSVFVVPFSRQTLVARGILPDLRGLEIAAKLSLPVIYRPAPVGTQSSETVVNPLKLICERFPNVVGLSPSGEIVAGYPDIKGLAALVRERNLFVTQVEFSRQIGDKPLQWSVWPRILSLHSVTDEEVMSRRIDRKTMVDRMVRAAAERSVSLLLFRVDPLGGGRDPLKRYSSDISELRNRLADRGIDDRWPSPMPDWGSSPTGALAMVLICLLTLWGLARRFKEVEDEVSIKAILFFTLLSVLLALISLRVSSAAKMIGGFATAFVASEAVLMALEGWKKPGRALIAGPLVAILGGMAVGSFHSAPLYMMRLIPFSGVKLTLFLPILVVLFHDLHRKVHPENLGELMGRPPIWGEIFIAGFLVAAAGLMVFRSGNVSSVPGWEIAIRDALEDLLVARPRTKEAFLGYPCLMLWFYVRRNDWIPRYREVLRLGATVAFSSLVNTFCHFHTALYITFLRVFNGWWTGILLGLLVIVVLRFCFLPFLMKYGRGAEA